MLFETTDDAETDGGDDREADGADGADDADGAAAPGTVVTATEPATKAFLGTDGEACGEFVFQFGTYVAEGEAVIKTTASPDGAGAGEGGDCQVCMRRKLEVGLRSKYTHTISDDALGVYIPCRPTK